MVCDDVTIQEASLCPRCNLYAYKIDEHRFDDLALAAYFASGKFDKTTIHRWTAGKLLTNPHKAQNFRASVDNAIFLLPVDGLARGGDSMRGHAFIVCYENDRSETVVVAIGVATDDPFELTQSAYARYVLPVHVLTTLCGETNVFSPGNRAWTTHPSLPTEVFLLVDDLGDVGDVDDDEPECEYTRQKRIAAEFRDLLERSRSLKTPSPTLERERVHRVDVLVRHLESSAKTWSDFPPTRRKVGKKSVQGLAGVLDAYEKHASRFGKLFPSL